MRHALKIFICLMFISVFCFAEGEYDYKDYTNKNLLSENSESLQNITIVGSCFYQVEGPKTVIFPAGADNITFKNCNLDNVLLPSNSTLIDCTNKNIIEIDEEDWIVDDDLNPIYKL